MASRGVGAVWGVGVYWGWQGVQVLRGQQGYQWHQGAPRGVRGKGPLGDVRWLSGSVRGALGTGRECSTQGPAWV